MKQKWQDYSDKYLQLTSREQLLVLFTGVIAIFFIISYVFIDDKSAKIITFEKQNRQMTSETKTLTYSIEEYQRALKEDPDQETQKNITQLENKLTKLDNQLGHLTTDIISPTQMREALLKLLKLEPGVSLLSFELISAQPLLDLKNTPNTGDDNLILGGDNSGLNLYKHGIKLKLSGQYFQLRNYLRQLEQLSWKFFWQDFQFQVKEYPQSEVDVTIYSLGLHKEFVGV